MKVVKLRKKRKERNKIVVNFQDKNQKWKKKKNWKQTDEKIQTLL